MAKFKVGDRIRHARQIHDEVYTISAIGQDYYLFTRPSGSESTYSIQSMDFAYELAPLKWEVGHWYGDRFFRVTAVDSEGNAILKYRNPLGGETIVAKTSEQRGGWPDAGLYDGES